MSGVAAWTAGRRRVAVLVGCAAVFAVVAAFLVAGGGGAAARPLGRGAPLIIAARPGALNEPASVASVNGMRSQAHREAVSVWACLDRLAARTAALFASGTTPSAAPSGCGAAVQWGWVAGLDPSGAQMLRAAYARTPSGVSPLLASTARRIGFTVGPRTTSGVLTGYVLIWVVSA